MNSRNFADALAAIGCDETTCARFKHITLPFVPMPHQLAGLSYALNYGHSGLFFEPRTGKTLVLQMLAIYYAYYGMGTLQIMPPGLFQQFLHDYHAIEGHRLRLHVLRESPAARTRLMETWGSNPDKRPHVVLLSREIYKSAWASLYLQGFRITHFDESHLGLQSERSEIAKTIRQFIHQNTANRLVLSTGTPIPNQISNAYCTMNFLRPDIYETRAAFNHAHCVYKTIYIPGKWGQPRGVPVIDSYTNLDYLSEAMYSRSVYAAKRDVLNLEAPNIQIVECALRPKHRRLYTKVLNERILEIGDTVIDARAVQKLRQVALQLITVPEEFAESFNAEDSSVYETVAAIVDSVNPEKERVVVFANYIRSVESLARKFKAWEPAIVYGPNGPEKNAKEVERFHRDSDCRVLIANPAAGGVGFKLGDVAQTVIFAEPVSSPGVFDQCLSRVMLKGQTEPVVCYIVRVQHTISELAIDQMLNKAVEINQVTRSKRTLLDELLGRSQPDTETDPVPHRRQRAALPAAAEAVAL